MTANLMERSPNLATRPGDEALATINSFRRRPEIDDRFNVQPLEAEFYSLSRQLGSNAVWVAAADNNNTGAFKWRGAANALNHLAETIPPSEQQAYAVTAGNHGLGIAAAAHVLQFPTAVVVPHTASLEKRQGIRRAWDDPRLTVYTHGNSFDEALAWAHSQSLGQQVHAYDNPYVIAGQGTIADDILEKMSDLQHIVMPVGGGGLVSGVLQRLAELGRSDITVHGVEAEGSDSLSRSLGHEIPQQATRPNQRYGGSAVQFVGQHVLDICNQHQAQLSITTASERAVDDVIFDYIADYRDRLIDPQQYPPYELTSVVAFAGLSKILKTAKGRVAVVGTGHNAPLEPARASLLPTPQIASGRHF